ncbi:hypothetical protein Moror_14144 [Moniliophthora roreri MCA 2997]|uniref:Uncharacterized protein n=1 Tax=Moniliophthora roreri (strain MCA 2997) TaxID=1381753 RepID=V2XPT3_MONRO|nr:hypothetical protein Moror_14144 [Moniliophthora roreri MCA 2997]
MLGLNLPIEFSTQRTLDTRHVLPSLPNDQNQPVLFNFLLNEQVDASDVAIDESLAMQRFHNRKDTLPYAITERSSG